MTQLLAANVQVLVEIVVGQDADLRALPNAQIPVKLRHHNHVQVVRMVVRDIAQKLVRMLVKHRQRNTALIVPAIARLDVQLPVRIRVRLKPHKDVTDAVIHAKQAVEDNAIGLVVAHVTNSVKVHV